MLSLLHLRAGNTNNATLIAIPAILFFVGRPFCSQSLPQSLVFRRIWDKFYPAYPASQDEPSTPGSAWGHRRKGKTARASPVGERTHIPHHRFDPIPRLPPLAAGTTSSPPSRTRRQNRAPTTATARPTEPPHPPSAAARVFAVNRRRDQASRPSCLRGVRRFV